MGPRERRVSQIGISLSDFISHIYAKGNLRVSTEIVDNVRTSFVRSPHKSVGRASRETGVPRSTVRKVIRKQLRMKPYRIQLSRALAARDKETRLEFCAFTLEDEADDDSFLFHALFLVTRQHFISTAHRVNRHNVRICGVRSSPTCDGRTSKRFS